MTKPKTLFVIFLTALLLGFIYLVAWWFQILEPRKNVFGRASLEKLISECELTDQKVKIRLYRGEPDATSSFWYSITATGNDFSEAQIFYTYKNPEILAIECQAAGLSVSMANGQNRTIGHEEVLSLVKNPQGINDGKTISH